MDRRKKLWEGLHSSFWFLPTCLVLAAGLLGILLVEIDYRLDVDPKEEAPRIFAISAEGAQGLLQAIATSMITVAGVIFSITILILNEASNQYSPRILRNFVRDRRNQVVLGVFLAVFVYCIVVLRAIHDTDEETFVPPISVLAGIFLALVGIGFVIFFIHHIAYSIQASTILQRIVNETLDEINELYPDELGAGMDESSFRLPTELEEGPDWRPLNAGKSGYLEVTRGRALLKFAEDHDTVLRLEYKIGEFVVEGTPLVSVYGKEAPSGEAAEELLQSISISAYRTIEQDASFGIRQLVDVSLKALSPSMNDTTTAIMCIDHLTVILTRLVQRKIESPFRLKNKRLRLIVNRPDFDDLLNDCTEQIRQNAGGNVATLNHLIHMLATAVPLTTDRSRLRAIEGQLDLLRQTVELTIVFPADRERLLIECDRTRQKIRIRRGGEAV